MILAFLQRDWRVERTYRAAVAGHLLGGLLFLASFAVVAPIVDDDFATQHGAGYASWAAIGIIVTSLLLSTVQSVGGAIRQAQLEGSLEVALLAPARSVRVLLSMGAFPVLAGVAASALSVAVVAVAGGALDVQPLTLVLVATLSLAAFSGLGLVSAGAVLVARRGDPVVLGLAMLGGLSAGAYAPVETFPAWLRAVAGLNPLTYALDGWRGALLEGTGPAGVAGDLAVLAAAAAVLVPAGLWTLHRGVAIAKADGLLAGY